MRQHALSQSLASLHDVEHVFTMQGPEQHQVSEQFPPGPAHTAAFGTSGGTPPGKHTSVTVQTPGPSKQHRLSQSMLDSHGPAQTSELQIALPQQGLSQLPPGGEHSNIGAGARASVAVPLSRWAGLLPAPELARIELSRRDAALPAVVRGSVVASASRALWLGLLLLDLVGGLPWWKHLPPMQLSEPLHRKSAWHAHRSDPVGQSDSVELQP